MSILPLLVLIFLFFYSFSLLISISSSVFLVLQLPLSFIIGLFIVFWTIYTSVRGVSLVSSVSARWCPARRPGFATE